MEQLVIEGDTYIFVVSSLLDNSYGFIFDEDGVLPGGVLGATTSFQPLKGKWFEYSTT